MQGGKGEEWLVELNSLRADRRLPLKEEVAGGSKGGGESTVTRSGATLATGGREKGAIKDRRPKSTDVPRYFSLTPFAFSTKRSMVSRELRRRVAGGGGGGGVVSKRVVGPLLKRKGGRLDVKNPEGRHLLPMAKSRR